LCSKFSLCNLHLRNKMRLLKFEDNEKLSLTEHAPDMVPPYVILSHTWGSDDQEVTYEDVMKDIGKDKTGYQKIEFCRKWAARDGFKYFWIDTCCTIQTQQLRQYPVFPAACVAENDGSSRSALNTIRRNFLFWVLSSKGYVSRLRRWCYAVRRP
jgi:Heterokaryon incompatibility protein (HET)